MVKLLSESVIAEVYQKILMSSPKMSANAIIKASKGTNTAMRRQDALVLIKNLKRSLSEVADFTARNKKTDIYKNPGTAERIEREALKLARKESLFESRKRSTLKSRRASVSGKQTGTVRDMRGRMYNRHPTEGKDEYIEFYG